MLLERINPIISRRRFQKSSCQSYSLSIVMMGSISHLLSLFIHYVIIITPLAGASAVGLLPGVTPASDSVGMASTCEACMMAPSALSDLLFHHHNWLSW
jgi:hypothetical protein